MKCMEGLAPFLPCFQQLCYNRRQYYSAQSRSILFDHVTATSCQFLSAHLSTDSAASVLLISLIINGTFKTGIVSALSATTTDATSTVSDTTTASTSLSSANSTASTTDANSTSATLPVQTQTQAQSQPSSDKPTFKLVHVVGSKYIDYFTDGKKTYSFPGNPDIDSNLNKPNAPIPSHAGLTWVSTSGMEAYDTPSGDLESADYAQESDGSFITNVPAYTYTDATSSVPIAAHTATSKTDPTVATQ